MYMGGAGERSKCVKFVNGLRPEVKMMVNCHGIHNFAQLTNMCRIFDEDQREKVAFYRNANASHGKSLGSSTMTSPSKRWRLSACSLRVA